jgi:thiol:disulfide interchange protein DsbA
MKSIKQIFAVLLLLCATAAFADAPVAGKDYTLVNPSQPTQSGNKIEVLEFFFYGCIHCYHLDPYISSWEKTLPADVSFTYIPAVFNATWEVSARTFYALEALGASEKLHDPLFNAWNGGLELLDQDSNADFVARYGVDRSKFNAAYNSFSVQSAVMRAKQLGQTYGIRGTPTLIVNGKYLITGLQPADTMRVLDALIDKVRSEQRPASAVPAIKSRKK